MKLYLINMTNAPKPALGIVMDSPQPDVGGARTWNGKPDPFGERPINEIIHIYCVGLFILLSLQANFNLIYDTYYFT